MAAKLGASGRRRLTRALILRDGDTCHYCSIELFDEIRSLDHVVPLADGGTNEQKNLVLACKRCNFLKDDTSYEEFMELRSWLEVCHNCNQALGLYGECPHMRE